MYKMSKLMEQREYILVIKKRWFAGTAFRKVADQGRDRINFFTICRVILTDRETGKPSVLVEPWIKIKIKAACLLTILIYFVSLYLFKPHRHLAYLFYLYVQQLFIYKEHAPQSIVYFKILSYFICVQLIFSIE